MQILQAYESPIAPDKAAAYMSGLDNFANVIFTLGIGFIGKRRLYLAVLFGIFVNSIVVAVYGFIYLPTGFVSFDYELQSFRMENSNLTYIPMVCLFLWSFFSYTGLIAMPWILLSELYSFK